MIVVPCYNLSLSLSKLGFSSGFLFDLVFVSDRLLLGKKICVGLDGKKLESESNVLLASIENMQYAVTLDV
ncbi:hypothetical protein L6452_00702 [Arctium lappa]|uniref:Uncharacterized protein n=1 Tax=Arctium lappa TaxID=4217 RepID=A0ACB9FFL7_ARCLA|nr:hypothetical protein L6452_00702 [Arctium lappa]